MSNYPVHFEFPGRIVFIGFGSIGQGVLPLILRHIGIPPSRMTIVTADDVGRVVDRVFRENPRTVAAVGPVTEAVVARAV